MDVRIEALITADHFEWNATEDLLTHKPTGATFYWEPMGTLQDRDFGRFYEMFPNADEWDRDLLQEAARKIWARKKW